ncbi:MAG: hypothetical protein CVT72_05070 [Alphaproteobacteria bacterium HGW-Alphaproteobacteria-11]|nr:MAG: hypothetical protein CVT72_05070 [Alphaproteobacteria bacterium HGW-Alphaproteobacteria-11]
MSPRQKNADTFNPNGLPMRLAATYERTIEASLARAWENVFDWEHLPHLHSDSFSVCDLEERSNWGWRARTRAHPASSAPDTVIELVVDHAQGRYVSRTLSGPLPGVEIWTRFQALAPRRTRVGVEFHLPHLTETQAEAAGARLVVLYTKLWDEDEAMMVARQKALDGREGKTPAHIVLGPIDELLPRLPLTLETTNGAVRLVNISGEITAYPAQCPHMLAPLTETLPNSDCEIVCPWHSYRFDIRSGLSTDGRGLSLGVLPRVELDERRTVSLRWP